MSTLKKSKVFIFLIFLYFLEDEFDLSSGIFGLSLEHKDIVNEIISDKKVEEIKIDQGNNDHEQINFIQNISKPINNSDMIELPEVNDDQSKTSDIHK